MRQCISSRLMDNFLFPELCFESVLFCKLIRAVIVELLL